MADILKEILERLPQNKISEAAFEGANIVLYTKDKDFFLDNKGMIREVVQEFKKRIELRPDPSVTLDLEKAKKLIKTLIPEEAGIGEVIFDPQRSQVVIEVEKPGMVIGKQGEILREIRSKTLWVPVIKRNPPLRSKIIEGIRGVLYQNSDERRKFLNRTGKRIYDGWIRGKKNEWIRITYLGSGRQVGRSCILLQTPESRILMDCGIDAARNDSDAYPYLDAPELKIDELDAVVISHAHLDHSALVPYLIKYGYKGPIYCTEPTRDIMALLQLDYVKIMRNEGKEPLYTSEEVKEMVKQTICLNFEEVSDITPDIRLTFYPAGHILGSAMAHLHVGNGLHNLLYTGDLKYANTYILERAATRFPRLETVMIEATYGGRDNIMPSKDEEEKQLKEVILETVNRRGKILMPVLGSGRGQEVMVMLWQMVQRGELKEIPIYIDGMVWDITAIHTAYPEYLNSTMRKAILHKDQNPFLHQMFKRVGSQKERIGVVEEEGSCIVLATSGMLAGGPSVEYLKHFAKSDRNTLIFSCYQGEGSLGKRIREGERDITLAVDSSGKPERLEVKMQVHKLEFTNHADRKQLMNFIQRCEPRPKKVIVNHGENSRCLDLASSLHKMNRIETNAPRNLETLRLR